MSQSLNKWPTFSAQPIATSIIPSPKFFMCSALPFSTKEVEILRKTLTNISPQGPKRNDLVAQAPPKENFDEIFKSMEGWARDNILPLLKPAKECWQPQDFLPDASSDGFHDQLRQLQERTKEIPDEYFVVLVGNMITEEALPSYHSRINGTEIFHDKTGVDDTPWAIWARGWSAEENRHGDLLNRYLYLSGRVDMKQVETTIQYLIAAGMDVGIANNPYLWTIYTSFQERQTAIIHGNTARLAKQHGDVNLAQICGTIAADEKRHERAYTKMAGKLFELDPNGMLIALAYMMRRRIEMPSHLMYDGFDDHLYKHLTQVVTRIGVYNLSEHKAMLKHLMSKWKVEKLTGLSSEGREAQDYVCGLVQRITRLEEIAPTKATKEAPTVSFSWIFNRKA
ncbi:stearoyl-[acyl-carrier-protein] 9-desaturase, chloroplastic [Ziziphus jujuba]|uniref:Stearoyl-[acyl-carrier-protein] 9-desaturase, chloroplastic n=1 Tax=Ziziphus jujuba TaxID=326968 RepID=A0ABM4A0I7_ZIZJJ|nr:stearoyl-[acyl-carrier-protein] 9-desaturase, chloroplastic [Ziziphus jujuba]